MEYFYKMKLSDDTYKNITNSELRGQPLDYFDKYTLDGKLKALEKATAASTGLDVIKTNILAKPGNGHDTYEYLVIEGDNFYFDDDLFASVTDMPVYRYGKKSFDRVIGRDNELLAEMLDYLFDQLENNSEEFFKRIYDCKNDFREVLNKYVIAYKNEMNKEDSDNLGELKVTIKSLLSMYKIYRTVATKRYYYEKAMERKLEAEARNNEIREEIPDDERLTRKLYTETDEYFEPEEYEMMAGEGSEVYVPEGRAR